jgi:hypothetical protein
LCGFGVANTFMKHFNMHVHLRLHILCPISVLNYLVTSSVFC